MNHQQPPPFPRITLPPPTAFPFVGEYSDGSKHISPGLSRVDFFAAMCMQGLLANPQANIVNEPALAYKAVVCANALLSKLNDLRKLEEQKP